MVERMTPSIRYNSVVAREAFDTVPPGSRLELWIYNRFVVNLSGVKAMSNASGLRRAVIMNVLTRLGIDSRVSANRSLRQSRFAHIREAA